VTSSRCASCGTELAPNALACPACGALVHTSALKDLAGQAQSRAAAGDLAAARELWMNALQLLPAQSQQYAAISQRVQQLTRQIEEPSSRRAPVAEQPPRTWWLRSLAGIGTAALFLFGKLKFLLLGLTKASTFMSMFAFFGVYWSVYGWPLALGLVVAIYVHEMGHVAMLRRLGIAAGAPLFIPGFGALVLLKQRVSDPLTDAKIGLAGPMWGLGAALSALVVYVATGARVWLAIAQLTGFMNLFNLTPIWQLDGSRGLHVLARGERWALVAAIVVALWLTEQRLLFIVGGVAIWRSLQRDAGPGDPRVLATFVGLVVALSLLARGVG
jgi:Zn-dependent protease